MIRSATTIYNRHIHLCRALPVAFDKQEPSAKKRSNVTVCLMSRHVCRWPGRRHNWSCDHVSWLSWSLWSRLAIGIDGHMSTLVASLIRVSRGGDCCPRNIKKKIWAQVLPKFPPIDPKWVFPPLSAQPSRVIVLSMGEGFTLGSYLLDLSTLHQTHVHMLVPHCNIWRDSDAPKHRFRRTPDPWASLVYLFGRLWKMVDHVFFFYFVVLA
jgi:hypothetical protein